MCACVAAPGGGRVRGRTTPAALFTVVGVVLAALLVTGVVPPQVEWLSLPERLHHVKEKPRELWMHLLGIVLTVYGRWARV